MRVSKLLGFIILAALVCICFTLNPVFAGEHPWNDDQVRDTLRAHTIVLPDDPQDPTEPVNPDEPVVEQSYFGTSLFFCSFLVYEPNVVTSEVYASPRVEKKSMLR